MKEPQAPKETYRMSKNTALALASVGIAATAYILKAAEHQIDGYLNPVISIIIPNFVSSFIAFRKVYNSLKLPLTRETQELKRKLLFEGTREVVINSVALASMNLLKLLFK